MEKNRRKKYYVKEGGHKGLLVGSLILILVLIVIASSLFYILANRTLENETYQAHFRTLRNTMEMLLPWILIVNAIGLVVVLVLAVFFTHKISGPTFHIVKDLGRLGDGDLTVRIKLRRRDRLVEIADAFNESAGKLQQITIEVKKQAENLLADGTKTDSEIQKLRESLDKLKTQ